MQHHIRCVVGEVDEGGRRPAAARLVHAEQLVSAGNLRSALSLPIALRDKLTGLDARTFCSHDMLSSSIVLSPAHQSHDMRSAGIETARRTADVYASQLPAHHANSLTTVDFRLDFRTRQLIRHTAWSACWTKQLRHANPKKTMNGGGKTCSGSGAHACSGSGAHACSGSGAHVCRDLPGAWRYFSSSSSFSLSCSTSALSSLNAQCHSGQLSLARGPGGT